MSLSMPRVIFMGSCPFSLVALKILHHHYPCTAVYTAPPRPKGRGQKVQPTPVHLWCNTENIPVFTPSSLRQSEAQEELKKLKPDVIVVASYGLLLPKAVLEIPLHGCLNIHPSLLPRWRGASPIVSAIVADDKETGVCVMLMDEGMDTGPVLWQTNLTIDQEADVFTLGQQLAEMGAKGLCNLLPDWIKGTINPTPQKTSGVTISKKITKEEGFLNWSDTAHHNERKVKAYPHLTHSMLGNHILKILKVTLIKDIQGHPGQLMDRGEGVDPEERWVVACAQGALSLNLIRTASGKTMSLACFLRGNPIK